MLHFFWNLSTFIIALGVLITVHELGHFWMARRCGVMVKRFSIGFGRTLWRSRDNHGTEYVIAAIPLGGYVKMLDDRVDTVALDSYHKAFNHKTIWQRTLIIAAGPIFSFLFAIFAYWLVFLIGVPSYRPVIGEVIPYSIADQAKISPGMELKSVNGIETPDWDSARLQLINKIGDNETTLGVTTSVTAKIEWKTLNLRNWRFDPKKQDAIAALGIIPLSPRIEPVLTEVKQNSAAMKAGLQAGDKIVKIDNKPITEWHLFVTKIHNSPSLPLQVGIERKGNKLDINLQPDSKPAGKGKVEGFAGVVPTIIPIPAEYKIVQQYSPILALAKAGEKNWQLIRHTSSMLGKLLTGDVKLSNLNGPISIAQSAGISAEYGFIYYLMFLAKLSVNLGIINLFPLPILDGGHLLFLLIEKMKGRLVSEGVQKFSYYISSILLVFLISLAFFNDLSRI